jgi:general secretion pathway protein A
MYKEFYGLTTYPFDLTPDPKFLYLSENHENCLLYLLHGIEREYGLMVMTGEIGTGKTFLLNSLVKQLGDKSHVAYLVNPRLNPTDVLQYASQELHLDIVGKSKAELLLNLKSFLLTSATDRVIIIVDEAHSLSIETLEELRLLTNFETAQKKLIQIILVGQPQLEDVLKLSDLAQLNQRVGLSCHLLPMSVEETKNYIDKRLAVAGAKSPLFTAQAMADIFVHAQGIPRVINVMCDLALFFGYSDRERTIGPAIIKQVVENLNLYTPKQASGSAASVPSRTNAPSRSDSNLVQSFAKQPLWRRSKLPDHFARIAAIAAIISLLGLGVVLWGWRERDEIKDTMTRFVSRFALLRPATPRHSETGMVQWAHNNVSYRLPVGAPFRLPLPPLQNTKEGVPVEVTLDTLSNKPGWLTFNPVDLYLSGVAPDTGVGKTYMLTFRAHTAESIGSLLNLHVTLTEQTQPASSPSSTIAR